MIFLLLWSLPLMFGHSYDTVLLREGIYVVAMHEY